MSKLTVEDIHRIREEHCLKTRNNTFEEYKADLKKEADPLKKKLRELRDKAQLVQK